MRNLIVLLCALLLMLCAVPAMAWEISEEELIELLTMQATAQLESIKANPIQHKMLGGINTITYTDLKIVEEKELVCDPEFGDLLVKFSARVTATLADRSKKTYIADGAATLMSFGDSWKILATKELSKSSIDTIPAD